MLTMRSLISSGTKPLKVQIMLTTGMSMFGKIAVGVRTIASAPRIRMSIDTITNVYGRRSASLTIHMIHSGLAGMYPQIDPTAGALVSWHLGLRPIAAAEGTATLPDRTMSLAGIFWPYTRRLSPLSGRIVEPSRETPANRPRALE